MIPFITIFLHFICINIYLLPIIMRNSGVKLGCNYNIFATFAENLQL